VTRKANGAVGPAKDHHDAADGQRHDSTPSDAEALAALRTLRAWFGLSAPTLAIYTQHDLPPDAESERAYTDRHRALRKAGAVGVWVRGKLLCSTAAGWATELPKQKKTKKPAPANDVSGAMDAALGIRTKAGAR
jgi:hypothetical protein